MDKEQHTPQAGAVLFTDLTVDTADKTRDFYKQVIGWKHSEIEMGDYADYVMETPEGAGVAGICHRAGVNKNLPPVWLVYFNVEDLKASLDACKELGGNVYKEPESPIKPGSYAVIEYPKGTFCALSQI